MKNPKARELQKTILSFARVSRDRFGLGYNINRENKEIVGLVKSK